MVATLLYSTGLYCIKVLNLETEVQSHGGFCDLSILRNLHSMRFAIFIASVTLNNDVRSIIINWPAGSSPALEWVFSFLGLKFNYPTLVFVPSVYTFQCLTGKSDN